MSENRELAIDRLHRVEKLVENALGVLENEAETSDNLCAAYDLLNQVETDVEVAKTVIDVEYYILWDIERSEKSLEREMGNKHV